MDTYPDPYTPDEGDIIGRDLDPYYFPNLSDLDLATDVAVSAVEADPSVDLDSDEQELLAGVFLRLRGWVEWVHKLHMAKDITAADFYQWITESLERGGIGEDWRDYRRDPDVDPDEVDDDHPSRSPVKPVTDLRGDIEDDEVIIGEDEPHNRLEYLHNRSCPKCEDGFIEDGRYCDNPFCEWARDFDPRLDDPRL